MEAASAVLDQADKVASVAALVIAAVALKLAVDERQGRRAPRGPLARWIRAHWLWVLLGALLALAVALTVVAVRSDGEPDPSPPPPSPSPSPSPSMTRTEESL